jgi:glycyl-tRNA synthetase
MPSKPFNLMLSVALGPENKDKGYLRPETAQSVYLNFAQEFNVLRNRLPMGLAIIGKAYRNEISPRQGLYRLRELTQAELQIFFDPQEWNVDLKGIEDRKVNVMFAKAKEVESVSARELAGRYGLPGFYISKMVAIKEFYTDVLKIPEARFRFLEKDETERAFYNKLHMDIEVDVESWGGFREVGGLHYRGDYDLTSHSNGSGHDLSVNVNGKRVMPNVLELSFGVDRNVWAIIDIFYRKDGERSVLQVPPYLAPYNAAVFPLQKDERIDEEADRIFNALRKRMLVVTDRSGSIGRRYARMDEIGTPYCITVDYDTVDERSEKHGTVTVRDRDSKAQERVKADEIEEFLSKRLR